MPNELQTAPHTRRRCLAASLAALCIFAPGGARPASNPPAKLTLEAARQYMLALINRDRISHGRPPVVLDETASQAAQPHTDEMVEFGYSSHWSLDGKKPEQRYTEGGGSDADSENEYEAETDSSGRRLRALGGPAFSAREIESIEAAFFDEPAEEVNHRSNILDANHNRVGIALSIAGDASAQRTACTQEFINAYGTYTPLPRSVPAGSRFAVGGRLATGFHVQSVDVRFEELPKPLTTDQLWRTHSYGAPPLQAVVAAFYPQAGHPSIAVRKSGTEEDFAVDVATNENWRTGLYYVMVWAVPAGMHAPITVSERTIVIGARGAISAVTAGAATAGRR